MSAKVFNFEPVNGSVNHLSLRSGGTVDSISRIRKKTLDNYVLEINLIQTLKEGFVEGLNMFESDLIEGDIEENESIFSIDERLELLSVIGVFSQNYGTFKVNLSCTGKGHIEFSYCFDSPNISNCTTCFSKSYLKAVLGENYSESKLFESYLKEFMINGEISVNTKASDRLGELKKITNPKYPIKSKNCPINSVNKILVSSGQNYFTKHNIYVPSSFLI